MNSSFDYVNYHKYIRDMLAVMEDIDDPEIFSKLYNATIPALNLLRIGYMSNEYAEQARATGLNISEFALPPKMELGPVNRDIVVDVVPKVSDMVSIRIYAHPFVGVEWDDDDKELIISFLNLFFNLIARIRVLNMFENRIFHDPVYPFVGNLASLMRNITRLRNMGKLVGYTLYRMNIYKFSRYNHIFGRPVGDKIMTEYAQKLLSFSGEFGGVYRLGGDNFLGLIPNEMTPAVQKFFEGFTYINENSGLEVVIQARAGFYQICSNDETNDMIMGRANSTFAKTNPKEKICFFNIEEERLENQRNLIEGEFMQAMKDGDVIPYYQPKVDPQTDTIVGVEALCRWIKGGKIIPPFMFIPVLERNNQICALDFYMLRKVCEDLVYYINLGHNPVRVSVNFSRNNLADKNFVTKIIDIIDEYKIPHDLIIVELTETTLEADFEGIIQVVDELSANGLSVSVDDFGMGYSSMNLIKNINWNIIKIDKSLLPDPYSKNYEKSLNMLQSIISMINNIGMLSVIEGVEREEQVEIVKKFGCKVIQGYYYDRPMPKEELHEKLLGEYKGECKWHA